MSTQNHSGIFAGDYMSRIRGVVANVRTIKTLQINRSKRHSPQDARESVAKKLLDNLAFLRDPTTVEQPDLVYRQQADNSYAVGIKYGNRWLTKLFGGASYTVVSDKESAEQLLELFAADALEGQFDDFIKPIMEANINARAKN